MITSTSKQIHKAGVKRVQTWSLDGRAFWAQKVSHRGEVPLLVGSSPLERVRARCGPLGVMAELRAAKGVVRLFTTEIGSLTAAEAATRLRVSHAPISKAAAGWNNAGCSGTSTT